MVALQIRPLSLFALSAVFAACGGSRPAEMPTPCPAFALPIPAPPEMLYPEDRATAVPDGNFPLVLSGRAGAAIALAIGATIVAPSLASTPVPSPLPSPAATPQAFASPIAYAVPQLQAATTYSVLAIFSPRPCGPGQLPVGSFTTR